MPRPRQRACLQSGLKLDLNRLVHRLSLEAGWRVGPYDYRWTNTYTGEEVATAAITVDMGHRQGRFRIRLGKLDQSIDLVSELRAFGGRQWYFQCPATFRRCSTLWMPPGAWRFCSRHAWKRQVAYASQFETAADRAHRGKAKIKAKLIGNSDPEEWDLPPKPKWMRWRTYERHVHKFDRYEELLDRECALAAMRLLGMGWR